MFYVFAVGSMLAYAVQATLLVHHARKMDGLSLAFYRTASFAVTLLPLLFGVSEAEILSTLTDWRLFVLSGLTGGLSLGLMFISYKYLSISFSVALSISTSTIATAALGWTALGEAISIPSMILIALILSGVLFFGLSYRHLPHLDSRFTRGMTIVFVSAMAVAVSKFFVAVMTRVHHPLVVGYFWEMSVALGCLALLIGRKAAGGKGITRISMKTFLTIAACASPTLLGTGLLCLATKSGPIAIVGAIGSGSLIVSTILGWLLYAERPHAKQWMAITLILVGIAGLRFLH